MNKVINWIGVVFRILVILFIFTVIQVSLIKLFPMMGLDYHINEGLFTTIYCIFTIIAMLIYSFVRSYKREPFVMTEKPNAIMVFSTIVIGFGLLGLVSVYLIAADYIALLFTPLQEDIAQYEQNVDRFGHVEAAVVPYWDTILTIISSFMLVPLAEELTFRAGIFGDLKDQMKPAIAALISAIIFGIFHGVSVHIGYAIICGMVMAMVYYYTRSIWMSYLIHAVFNFAGSAIFTLMDSGMFGDLKDFAAQSSFVTTCFEVFCIVPAGAGFMLLRILHKQKLEEKKQDEKNEEDTSEKIQEEVLV